VYAQTLANIAADQRDFQIDLGDTFMTDKYQPYADAQQQYLAQRYYLGLLGRSAPLYLALGNHDGEQAGRRDDTAVWSAQQRTLYFPNPVPDGFYTGNRVPHEPVGPLQDYYAWEWGDAHFVVLDPYWFTPRQGNNADNWDRTLGSEQFQWLKATLETSGAAVKFVFIHQLVGGLGQPGRGGTAAARLYEWGGYSPDGSWGFDEHRPGWGKPIHQLLVDNRVTAVFHGHDHLFAPEELDGILYLAVPQPSTARYDATGSAAEYGYGGGDVLGSPGHVRVAVSPGGPVTIDYVRTYLPQDETAERQNGMIDYTYTVKVGNR
jgi:cytolysin (calcineurin-like family phosphatase)